MWWLGDLRAHSRLLKPALQRGDDYGEKTFTGSRCTSLMKEGWKEQVQSRAARAQPACAFTLSRARGYTVSP